jgi:hypothetical protein
MKKKFELDRVYKPVNPKSEVSFAEVVYKLPEKATGIEGLFIARIYLKSGQTLLAPYTTDGILVSDRPMSDLEKKGLALSTEEFNIAESNKAMTRIFQEYQEDKKPIFEHEIAIHYKNKYHFEDEISMAPEYIVPYVKLDGQLDKYGKNLIALLKFRGKKEVKVLLFNPEEFYNFTETLCKSEI